MRIRLKSVLLWSIATAVFAVVTIPSLFVFTLPRDMLIVHAMPDFVDSGPVTARLALFRISLWRECPVDLHAPESVVGAATASYDDSSTRQKKVIRDLVAQLIDIGCSPNQYGENGLTALMGAVLSDNPELVSILLSLGADPLLRVKASSYRGSPSKARQVSVVAGMNVLEFAQWLQAKGLDRQNRKNAAAIVELLAHHIQQRARP